jgi:hypothetical protein
MPPGRGRLGGSYAPARAGARHADRVTPALQPDSVPAALVRPGGGYPATVLREGEAEARRGLRARRADAADRGRGADYDLAVEAAWSGVAGALGSAAGRRRRQREGKRESGLHGSEATSDPARAVRAARRASRNGSGVRHLLCARTISAAVSTSTRQPACTASGRVPGRVRSQQPTISFPIRRGVRAPRSSPGQSPLAMSGRCVTPSEGTSSIAPRWSASPARRGWSRPVASTISTSGGCDSARTAASSSGPSRSARSPGSYGAPARLSTTAILPSVSAAAAQAGSPASPAPRLPRMEQTKHAPSSGSGPIRQGVGAARASSA